MVRQAVMMAFINALGHQHCNKRKSMSALERSVKSAGIPLCRRKLLCAKSGSQGRGKLAA